MAFSIAKGIKNNVIEPHREEPPLLPSHEVTFEEEVEPSTPTRRVRSKTALRVCQFEDVQGPEEWFEEMEENEVDGQRLIALQPEAYEDVPLAPSPTRSMIRKAEVQYTRDVESILTEFMDKGQPLQVVHNVSLDDVKKNIDKWKASAMKEFGNLKDAKEAFTVVKRSGSGLPAGCRVVLGRGCSR